jgi:hypothetical protein
VLTGVEADASGAAQPVIDAAPADEGQADAAPQGTAPEGDG